MLTALCHMATLLSLKTSYESVILARLPFTPFSFMTWMTHRNLPGNDMRDAGIIFLYALCSLAIKPNLQKLLGHEPPRATPDTEQAAKMAEKLMTSFGMSMPE